MQTAFYNTPDTIKVYLKCLSRPSPVVLWGLTGEGVSYLQETITNITFPFYMFPVSTSETSQTVH